MNNFALTLGRRGAALDFERELRRYLPGLDVRLWWLGPRQAVIRGPLVRALEIDYADLGAGPLLRSLGVVNIRALADDETVALVAGRDIEQVPARAAAAVVARAAAALDWHLVNAGVPGAWALLGGADQIDWGSVRVGQIDTGYTPHPVFGFPSANWIDVAAAATFVPVRDPGEGSMFDEEPGGGIDTLHGVSGGHGTRIASVICGHDPAATDGAYFGVAPKVPLVPMRIADIVWINHAQREFAQAVEHLIGAARVDVINVSVGVFAARVIGDMRRAINDAYDAGVIMVCAAGNLVDPVVAPACLSRTIAVGGTTRDDIPWSGSSFGAEVDFSAPADDVRRAITPRAGRFEYRGGGDGTSYSSAITAGAAALWLAHHGAALDSAYPLPWQRIAAFTQLAAQTVRVPAVWQPGAFGPGIIDVEALLKATLPDAASLVEAPRA